MMSFFPGVANFLKTECKKEFIIFLPDKGTKMWECGIIMGAQYALEKMFDIKIIKVNIFY